MSGGKRPADAPHPGTDRRGHQPGMKPTRASGRAPSLLDIARATLRRGRTAWAPIWRCTSSRAAPSPSRCSRPGGVDLGGAAKRGWACGLPARVGWDMRSRPISQMPGWMPCWPQRRRMCRSADPDPYAGLPVVAARVLPVGPRDCGGRGSRCMELEGQGRAGARGARQRRLPVPDVDAVEESVYSDEESRVAICRARGVEAEAEHSFCFVYAHGPCRSRRDDRQSGLGYSVGARPAGTGRRGCGQGGRREGRGASWAPGRVPPGTYTVVFGREVAAALIAHVAQALSADAVQKGRSVFAGRVGETVGSPLLTLVDDGLAPGGMATNPFDGEGVPHRRTVLLEGGRSCKTYLHNSYTARKEGDFRLSTGNAERGSYRRLPREWQRATWSWSPGPAHWRSLSGESGQVCTSRAPRACTPG